MPQCAECNAESTDQPPTAVDSAPESATVPSRPRELGGPAGPEPTRYGDWEKKGRCIDF